MTKPIEVNHNQLEEKIELFADLNMPLFIWGAFGIGKSETTYRVAKNMCPDDRQFDVWSEMTRAERVEALENPDEHFIFHDERLANKDPSEVDGIPNIDGDYIRQTPYTWAEYITKEESAGVVFLDELNLAPNATQAAAYRLIHDREIAGSSISEDVSIIAAGNRAEDRAKVHDMPAPLKNRFAHVTLRKPSGGQNGSLPEHLAKVNGHPSMVGFLSSPMGSKFAFNFGDENRNGTVWSTPRTVEMASDVLKKVGTNDLDKARDAIAPVIGEGAAAEWKGFMQLQENVDIDEILQDPEKVKELDEHENAIDLKHGVLTGIAHEYKEDTDLLETLVEIASFLDKEFGVLMLRLAKNYHPRHFDKNIMDVDAFDDLSMDFVKYLDLNN